MRLIAYSSVLFSVLFFAVAFPFNKVVTASFSDEAGVAGFFGLFNSLTTASTFLVSLFLASRIYTRLGIINGVFLMPLTYIFSFLVFALDALAFFLSFFGHGFFFFLFFNLTEKISYEHIIS